MAVDEIQMLFFIMDTSIITIKFTFANQTAQLYSFTRLHFRAVVDDRQVASYQIVWVSLYHIAQEIQLHVESNVLCLIVDRLASLTQSNRHDRGQSITMHYMYDILCSNFALACVEQLHNVVLPILYIVVVIRYTIINE